MFVHVFGLGSSSRAASENCSVQRTQVETWFFIFSFSHTMAKKLYVGNISWDASDQDLQDHFSQFGTVEEAIIITDRMSGRSKGFGFVTFAEDSAADAAIEGTHGKDWMGRPLTVNEARPPQPRD